MPTKMGGVPIRTCAGCRSQRPQHELIRVARGRDGVVRVDSAAGLAPGRGAYVCPDPVCIGQALESGRLARALRHEGPLPAGLQHELLKMAH